MKLCKDCEKKYFFWPKCEQCFKESEKHKNYISKEKLIKYLKNKVENDGYRSESDDAIYYSLIQKIENGDFDYE